MGEEIRSSFTDEAHTCELPTWVKHLRSSLKRVSEKLVFMLLVAVSGETVKHHNEFIYFINAKLYIIIG